MSQQLTRRDFLAAALAAGTAVGVPIELAGWSARAGAAGTAATATAAHGTTTADGTTTAAGGAPGEGIFLTDAPGRPRRSTCRALCARIVPTGDDRARDPGATEAGAVVFIDRFLSAFELPEALADGPGIYLHGRYSGRNPYPDPADGRPSHHFPPDDFVSPDGQHHFLALTAHQRLAWRVQLYGAAALEGAAVSSKWRSQVGSLVPLPNAVPLRTLYAEGLDAFDAAAGDRYRTSFARATAAQQDELLAAAAAAAAATGQGGGTAATTLPKAAVALFPQVVVDTYQACYSQPAYGGNHDAVMWRAIGWEGDTQPLGNSVYDRSLAGPGKGANKGFGDPAAYLPRGGYRQYRPVSGPDPAVRSRQDAP